MNTTTRLGALLTTTALAIANPALAQSVSTSGETVIEEVVVTATRRPTQLQETPIAVTAITGAQVEQSRVQSVDDALLLVPNANFVNATGSSGSYATLRGSATLDDAPGVDLPVTFFIDDVFYGSAASAYPDFYDVQQIEVLRGPQGTTFGRNVTGGAIVIRSREPEAALDGSISASIGNDSRYEARGFVTGPLGESLAGRLAFSARKYDGYQKNLFNGADEGGQEFYSLRGMLAFEPSEATKALLNISYTADKSPGVGYTFLVFGNGPSRPGFAGVSFPTDPDVTNGNVTPESDGTNLSTVLRINHDLGFADLTSVTAYRRLRSEYLNDADGTPLNIQTALDRQREEQWSQEFRLSSVKGERLEWIAGLYLLRQVSTRIEQYNHDAVPGTTLGFIVPGHLDARLTQNIQTTSVAPFFEGVFHFNDQWALRAGLRYTWEEKEGRTEHLGVNRITTFPVEYNVAYSKDWSATTPRVILEYKPSEDLFFYAGASRGFKSGGYTLNPTTAAGAAKPYDPEYVWNYEIGMRSDWLDQRLRFNLTAFQQETKDLQVRSWNGVAFEFNNAGETRAKGIELEVLARPTRQFDLGMSYGYIDAEYVDYQCTATINCAGREFALVPKQSLSAFAAARFPLGEGRGEIFTRLEAQFRSKVWFNATNDHPASIRDKSGVGGLFNGQIGWESESGDWRATLWGKNLTDERYVNLAVDLSIFYLDQLVLIPGVTGTEASEAVYRAIYNPGRTFGVTLTRNF